MKDKFKKATTASTERQKAILRRWAFNLFLKSVMSETVRRKSAGRERERERESSMPLDRRWRSVFITNSTTNSSNMSFN